jgi:hypothetical protein
MPHTSRTKIAAIAVTARPGETTNTMIATATAIPTSIRAVFDLTAGAA